MCICVCTVHVCGGIVHARMYAGVFVFMSVCVQCACLCMGSVVYMHLCLCLCGDCSC